MKILGLHVLTQRQVDGMKKEHRSMTHQIMCSILRENTAMRARLDALSDGDVKKFVRDRKERQPKAVKKKE
jgi:hypothetical protein